MAPKPKEINVALVEVLAAVGCTDEEIAANAGCSVRTLQRRFAGSIKKGRAKAKASLRRKQYQLAMEGNVAMLIWLGKNLLGQHDAAEVEHTGIVEQRHHLLVLPDNGRMDALEEVGVVEAPRRSLARRVAATTGAPSDPAEPHAEPHVEPHVDGSPANPAP